MIESRLTAHDSLWLRCRELLKEGCIPIETFDRLTKKRIERILTLQEKRLEEQAKALEEQRKEQERKMNKNTKYK